MMAENIPKRIARIPYATPVIAAAIGRSCSKVKRNTTHTKAEKSNLHNGTDVKSCEISLL
jgi:hypothetical protein